MYGCYERKRYEIQFVTRRAVDEDGEKAHL